MLPNLVSLAGLIGFVLLAWALSNHRKHFPWATVLPGLALQFILGLIILKTTPGREFFEWSRLGVQAFLSVANEGALMVFGPLADDEAVSTLSPDRPIVLAITITATIILVSTVSALLYHWGVLQRVVQALAWLMRRTMKLSGSESLATAANIFMGQTEAPLLIRPYLKGMTRSELMAMMTGGMATIAGGVLAIYAGLGIDAGHLLTASFMSAPAALVISKIMVPEIEVSQTGDGQTHAATDAKDTNSLDALCRGASDGMSLSINVIAMLLAFTALLALANLVLAWPQSWFGISDPLTLQILLGYLNAPFAILIGVPPHDSLEIGAVLGERIVLNEFVGYLSLTDPATFDALDERSRILATYALCGFANFSSIAIQVGGISKLEPSRRPEIVKLGLRSMIAGLLASYSTAAMVGILL